MYVGEGSNRAHPVNEFKTAVEMFDKSRAAFHPVPVIAVSDAVDLANFGVMDMAADNAVNTSVQRYVGEGVFKVRDKFDGILHLQFQVG